MKLPARIKPTLNTDVTNESKDEITLQNEDEKTDQTKTNHTIKKLIIS